MMVLTIVKHIKAVYISANTEDYLQKQFSAETEDF